MPKLVSPSTVRLVAEITPIESDWFSPNGLPIAATGSPTAKARAVRERHGHEVEAVGIDLDQGDVRVGVEADDLRRNAVAVAELDEDLLRLLRRAAAVQAPAAGDHVGVGDDVAVLVDDEAGALAGGAAAAEQRSRSSRRRR